MNKILDILIPRFVTDLVAIRDHDDASEIVCCIGDLTIYDQYDRIATVRTFNLFGIGLFPHIVEADDPINLN